MKEKLEEIDRLIIEIGNKQLSNDNLLLQINSANELNNKLSTELLEKIICMENQSKELNEQNETISKLNLEISKKTEMLDNLTKALNEESSKLTNESKNNLMLLMKIKDVSNVKEQTDCELELLKKTHSQCTEISQNNILMKDQIKTLENKLKDCYSLIEENKNQNQNLLNTLTQKEEKIREMETYLIKTQEEKYGFSKEISRLNDDLNNARNNINSITNQQTINESEAKKLKEELVVVSQTNEEYCRVMTVNDSEIKRLNEELSHARTENDAEIKRLNEELNKFKLQNDELRRFNEQDDRKNSESKMKSEYEMKIKNLNNKYISLEKDFKENQEKNRQNQKFYAEKNQIIEKEKEKLDQKIKELTELLENNKKYNEEESSKELTDKNQIFFSKYDSSSFKIAGIKQLLNLKWYLLVKGSKTKDKELQFTDFVWVNENDIFEDKYERDKELLNDDENLKQQIENLLLVQNNLMDKITNLENYKTKSGSTGDKDTKVSEAMISLEKYEKLISQLNEETSNYHKVLQSLEIIKGENEQYKKIIELNKDVLEKEKPDSNNMSFIVKGEGVLESKFLEDGDEINDLFNQEEQDLEQNNFSLNPNMNNKNSPIKTNKVNDYNSVGVKNTPLEIEKKLSINSIKTRKTDTVNLI